MLAALFACSVMALYGQAPSASLSGTVQDEQEGVVRAAKVTLRDGGRGIARETATDGNGAFAFAQVTPGTYELQVERGGFATARFEGMDLRANEQRSLQVKLQIATRGEAVVVTGELPLVREGMAVATSVDRGFIANQPLNGRTFQSLIHLSPGVVFTPASLPEQGQFSVNGQRTGTNYFSVDGVGGNFGLPFATTPYEGAGGGTPSLTAQGSTSALASVDAVQEFTIQTSTVAPEYGRQPGAQVAIVTRSGTNQLHGSAFEYLRNDQLDANSWFGNYNRLRRPALRQNDFGFTVGGPVLLPRVYSGKNRTFFFVSYEGLRLIQPVISVPSRVPSLEARERATGMVKSLMEAYPLPVAGPLAGTPLETPYVTGFSNPSRLNATGVRLDHSFSQRVSVFGRFQYAPSENRERGRYATPSFVAVLPGKTETATVGATMVVTNAVTNDLRFNWSRSLAAQVYEQDTFGGAKILPREILFPSFADPATSLYYLTIGANDENTISPGTFSRNTQRQINVVNTTSWNAGTHAVKFGVDVRRLSPSIGGRNFGKTLVVPSITQLATGIVASAEIRQVDSNLEPRYTNFSAFVQDAWRAGRRFTLTYGVRWELNLSPGEANGNLPLTLTGIENPSTARLAERGTRLYETSYRNFAPRVGISWQPWRGHDTVVRAGLGWFYDLGYAFTGTAFTATNYPFSRIRTVANAALSDPVLFAAVGAQSLNPPYPRLFDYYDDYKPPYTRQYSVAVEQPLGGVSSVSVSYVGAAGRRLARVESLRPQTLQNPLFTRVDAVSNGAYSDYHSLQTQWRRRMSRGFQALVSYTWAKSLDTASDESIVNLLGPLSRGNVDLDRGPSTFDIRHVFTGAASYELPRLGGGRAVRAMFGGFAFDSIVRMRGATPVTVVTGRDPLGLGLTNVARPDVVAGQPLYLYGDGYAGGKVYNAAAFDGVTPLAQARQGTLGRGVMRGFGLQQVDLSVRRRFTLTEGVGLDFRADGFNLFNTANFANPVGVLTNANFGRSTQIVSTSSVNGLNPLFQVGGPRSVQLSFKLQF